MSGRTKRILYRIFSAVAVLAAYAGALGMLFLASGATFEKPAFPFQLVFYCFLAAVCIFPIEVAVHEIGHLLFGFIGGMKFLSVSMNRIAFSRTKPHIRFSLEGYAGATQMVPKNGNCMRKKIMLFTAGGMVLNLIYGAVFLVLFFTVERYPTLLFFELFAPLNLMEGLIALYPAELPAGKTDGAVFSGLICKSPEEDVMLRIFQAQGILHKGSFSEISRELLFDAPVIREDEAAFCALTQLRWQYLVWNGDEEGAIRECGRLEALTEYLPKSVRAEISCDLAYAYAEKGNAEKASRYLLDAETASKTCAYRRAEAAVRKLNGRSEGAAEEALALAEKLPLNGMREFEKKLLRSL